MGDWSRLVTGREPDPDMEGTGPGSGSKDTGQTGGTHRPVDQARGPIEVSSRFPSRL